MKAVLAVVALTLVALVLDEKARQVAGDAQHAYGEAAEQARDASKALTHSVGQRPLVAILMAAGCGYVMAKLVPRG